MAFLLEILPTLLGVFLFIVGVFHHLESDNGDDYFVSYCVFPKYLYPSFASSQPVLMFLLELFLLSNCIFIKMI